MFRSRPKHSQEDIIKLFNRLDEAKNNQSYSIAGVRDSIKKMGFDKDTRLNDVIYQWIREKVDQQKEVKRIQEIRDDPVEDIKRKNLKKMIRSEERKKAGIQPKKFSDPPEIIKDDEYYDNIEKMIDMINEYNRSREIPELNSYLDTELFEYLNKIDYPKDISRTPH